MGSVRFPNSMLSIASRLLKYMRQLARYRLLTCILMGLLPIGIRLVTLPYVPIPDPMVSDEFSYLLGADTFASGRLTNPPHPMWMHFETWHVVFQPTYSSRYPPAQALFLAVGQKFLGHPLFGVWLSFGLLCACLCWMLQGWLPPVYALLGTLVGMGQIGIFGYWMNSYWGGAIAAAGGCLVLGALPRLERGASMSAAVFGSLGVSMIAFSRPLEGGVGLVVAGVLFLIQRRRRGRKLSELIAPAVLIPVLLIGSLAAGAMARYNYRVTGHPLLLPYILYERTYVRAPFLLFLPLRQLTYHNDVMRKYYSDDSVAGFLNKRAHPWRNVWILQYIVAFYTSTLIFFAVLVGTLFSSSFRVRTALVVLAALFLTVLVEKSPHIHYIAPGCGLFFVIAMYGIRFLCLKAQRFGPALLLLFVFVVFGQGLMGILQAHHSDPSPRTKLTSEIMKMGGKHLVLVRYDLTQHSGFEYVYNNANIDRSPIVWAWDMGQTKNQELLDYYPDRKAWLLQPDFKPPDPLTPYSAEIGDSAGIRQNLR